MLDRVLLKGTEESPPRLSTLLEQIGGRAPLLVEIKAPGRHIIPLCFAVRRALEGYRGKVAVMSFNPLVFAWFAAPAPPIVRGLGVGEEDKSGPQGRIEPLLSLWRAGPEFSAYDVREFPPL